MRPAYTLLWVWSSPGAFHHDVPLIPGRSCIYECSCCRHTHLYPFLLSLTKVWPPGLGPTTIHYHGSSQSLFTPLWFSMPGPSLDLHQRVFLDLPKQSHTALQIPASYWLAVTWSHPSFFNKQTTLRRSEENLTCSFLLSDLKLPKFRWQQK